MMSETKPAEQENQIFSPTAKTTTYRQNDDDDEDGYEDDDDVDGDGDGDEDGDGDGCDFFCAVFWPCQLGCALKQWFWK